MLRLIRSLPVPEPEPPRVVGVDDWALRKGRTYGTIVVDLDRRRVLDLLPDRTAETLADWLGSGKNLGRYAASWIACWPRPRRPSSTAALTWSTRCAPRGDQRICLRLFMRALTRWLTVPSAREVEIGLPAR
jgi:hypothetical protein